MDTQNQKHVALRNQNLEDFAMGEVIMAGALVILFGVTIFLFVFCIYATFRRRLYLHLPHPTQNASRVLPFSVTQEDHFATGLDPQLLEALPIFVYKPQSFKDWETECSVCLCEFEDGDKLRLLPNCNHSFHATCIDMWFYSHSNCPLCRARLDPAAEEGIGDIFNIDRQQNTSSPELERSSTTESLTQISVSVSINSNVDINMSTRPTGFARETEEVESQSSKFSRLHALKGMIRDWKVFRSSQAENGGQLQS